MDAPLGEEVFGGKPVLQAAQKDLQSKLSYPVLFKCLMPDQVAAMASTGITNKVISDRLYNVEQIALASMGPNSIIDDAQKVCLGYVQYIHKVTRIFLMFPTLLSSNEYCTLFLTIEINHPQERNYHCRYF